MKYFTRNEIIEAMEELNGLTDILLNDYEVLTYKETLTIKVRISQALRDLTAVNDDLVKTKMEELRK